MKIIFYLVNFQELGSSLDRELFKVSQVLLLSFFELGNLLGIKAFLDIIR